MKSSHFALLIGVLGASLFSARPSNAITVSSASPGYLPDGSIPGPPGLQGSYWDRDVAEIPVDGNALAQGGYADTTVYPSPPTGTFIFTATGDYLGNDLSVVDGNPGSWLGIDAVSYTGIAGNMDDGIIRLQGYVQIEIPNTIVAVSLNTDDGSRLFFADQQSITNDGSHGDVTVSDTVTFVDPGFYPVEVRFFNGDWTSDGGHNGSLNPADHGGANFRFATGGLTLVQSVIPEPSILSLVAGFVGVAAILRRRRK
jgi:hypothetical protein